MAPPELIEAFHRRPARGQFGLAALFRALLLLSVLLAVLRLPEPWSYGLMALIGSIALARLGRSFCTTALLGMYGSMGGVWLGHLGSCLLRFTWTWEWEQALLASWACMPLGICVGVMVDRVRTMSHEWFVNQAQQHNAPDDAAR